MAGWLATGVAASGLCANPAMAQDAVLDAPPSHERHPASEDDLRCLTLAVAYEAGNQSIAGQEAVAEVVLNRAEHPAFPHSVCDVVFQGWTRHTGCQFTFACDGAIDRRLPMRVLSGARSVAERVASGTATARVAGALNYHANYVSPAWASRLDRVAQIGVHIFYRPELGSLPEGGRVPLRAGVEGEGGHAIRRYAAYFADLSAHGHGADFDLASATSAPDQPARASQQPFLPWGLSLR